MKRNVTALASEVSKVSQPVHLHELCHNPDHFGGLFALKQWTSSSLKHDRVPRVFNLYCFYVKTHQNVLHYGMVKIVNTFLCGLYI